MAGLPQSGVELVAQGASAYIGDIDRAAKATDSFTNGLGNAAGKSGAFGQVITGALRQVGVVAVEALGAAARAVGGFLKDSVTSAADVEQTLAVMGATSGATAEQLELVRDTAIKLGGDLSLPATSAQDASEAMLELTKAGFTVEEAMAAAKGTLQLAAAAEVEAGEAAAITAQAINAFGLEAADAAHVADLLAGGANASSASMTDLAQGLQQGGAAFNQANQSVDDLVVAVSALTNAGLTGSDAGTALKNTMMRLMNPTDKAAGVMRELGFSAYDAQGVMKPWPQLLDEIRKATADLTPQQRDAALGTIFLSDGMKALGPLLEMTTEEYAAFSASVTKAGSAEAVAAAQTQGFNGAIAGLQSQMETLQLIIGTQLLPLLTPLIQQFSAGAAKVAEFASTFLNLLPTLAASDDKLRTFFNILRVSLDDSWNPMITAVQTGIQPFIDFGMAVATLASAFEKSGANGLLFNVALNDVLAKAGEFGGQLRAQVAIWAGYLGKWIIDAIPGMGANMALFAQNLYTRIGEALPGIIANLQIWGQRFAQWVIDAVPLMLVELGVFVASMLGYLVANLPAIVAQLTLWAGAFLRWLVDVIPQIIVKAAELSAQLVQWMIDSYPKFQAEAAKWGQALVQWVIDVAPRVRAEVLALGAKLMSYLNDIAEKAKADGSVGAAIIAGIKKGIDEGVGALKAAVTAAANAALKAAKITLGILSPSKVFEAEVGYQMSAGIAEGIMAGSGLINTALAGATTAAIAKPGGGGGSNTTNNSRVLNFSPSYGAGVRPSPMQDVSLARSLAL